MTNQRYTSESAMYPDVVNWLRDRLERRAKGASVHVADTHNTRLNEYISRHSLDKGFTQDHWKTFEIQVDVTGFVTSSSGTDMYFVECKLSPLTLSHLSQLLGYCRGCLAIRSLAHFTGGHWIGSSHSRKHLWPTRPTQYHWPKGRAARHITVARWSRASQSLDLDLVLPKGEW